MISGLFSRNELRSDVAAGITVAAMLVPQAMAYALLAGLPPEVGLYASTIPVVVYALLGTSRQLAIGPVAIVSLVSANAVGQVADEGTAGYLTVAAVLALLVGACHVTVGLIRIGFLVRLLSHPVLVGFTAAAALIIGTSQIRHVLGTTPDRADGWLGTIGELWSTLGDIDAMTVTVGAASLALMIGVRRFRKGAPVALIAVVGATAASFLFDLADRGVDVVGEVPAGLPPVTIPTSGELGELIWTLAPAALTITLVGALEAIAVAKVYAREHRYDLDPNREFIALGGANVAAGLFGGYPIGGAFSRTAVNSDAGARTKTAGIVTAVLMLLVLLFLTPLFQQLPQATLGAIVLLAVSGLFDTKAMRSIWTVRRTDGLTMLGAFVATLLLGVEMGIAVAVVGSIIVVAERIMQPHVAVLGRVHNTLRWRDVERYPEAKQVAGVTVVRFDTSLNYLNVEFMKNQVRRLVAQDPHALVLDLSSVNDVDTSAIDTLLELLDELDDDGVAVHLSTYRGPVLEILERTTIPERVAGIHEDVHEAALAAAQGPQPPGADEHHRTARLSRWRTVTGEEHTEPLVAVGGGDDSH